MPESELFKNYPHLFFNDGFADQPQTQGPETTVGSVVGSFLGGVFTGFTTFDPATVGLPIDKPHDSVESIANSVGHLVGFLGIPLPFFKLGGAARMALQSEKSILGFAKAFSKGITAGEMGIRTIPSIPGLIATKVMEGARSGLSSIKGLELLGMKQDFALGLLHGFTAGAVSGAPLTELDVSNRLETGLQMMMFTGGNRVLGNTITPGGKFDASRFWTTATDKQKIYLNSAVRAVASSALFGSQSTIADQPIEVQVYDYLINGIFGFTEKSWTHRAAIEWMRPHLGNDHTHKNLFEGELEKREGWTQMDPRVQEVVKDEIQRRLSSTYEITVNGQKVVVGAGGKAVAEAVARAQEELRRLGIPEEQWKDVSQKTIDEARSRLDVEKEAGVIETAPENKPDIPVMEEIAQAEQAVTEKKAEPTTFKVGSLRFTLAQLQGYMKDPTSLDSRELLIDTGIKQLNLTMTEEARLRYNMRIVTLTDMYYEQMRKKHSTKLTDEEAAEIQAQYEQLGIALPIERVVDTAPQEQRLVEDAERMVEAQTKAAQQATKEWRQGEEYAQSLAKLVLMNDHAVAVSLLGDKLVSLADDALVPRGMVAEFQGMLERELRKVKTPEEKTQKKYEMSIEFIQAVSGALNDPMTGTPSDRIAKHLTALKAKYPDVFTDGNAERRLRNMVTMGFDQTFANEIVLKKSMEPTENGLPVSGRWEAARAEDLAEYKDAPATRTKTYWERMMGEELFILKNVLKNGKLEAIHEDNTSLAEIINDMQRNGFIFVGGRKDNSQMFFAKQRFKMVEPIRENGKVVRLGLTLNNGEQTTLDVDAIRQAYAARGEDFDAMQGKLEARWNTMATGGKVQYSDVPMESLIWPKGKTAPMVYSDGEYFGKKKDETRQRYHVENDFVDQVFTRERPDRTRDVAPQSPHLTLSGKNQKGQDYEHDPQNPIILQNRYKDRESSHRMARIVEDAVERGQEVHILDVEGNRSLVDMATRYGATVVLHQSVRSEEGKTLRMQKQSDRPLRELMGAPQENSWWIQFAHNVHAWEKINGGRPIARMIKNGYLNDVFALNQRNQLILGSDVHVQNDAVFETIQNLVKGDFGQALNGSIVRLDPEGATSLRQEEVVRGKVAHAAMEAHLDGVMWLRSDVFEALMKYAGLDEEGISRASGVRGKRGVAKGSILSANANEGLLIGKLLFHKADRDLDGHLFASDQHFQMYNTAAKQTGERPLQYVDYDPQQKKYVYYNRDAKQAIVEHAPMKSVVPLNDIRLNPTFIEDVHSTENVKAVKQLLNNLPPHIAKAAFNAYVMPAFNGRLDRVQTRDLERAIDLYGKDPLSAEADALIAKIDVDQIGLKHIMDVMFGENASPSKLYEKIARKLLNLKEEEFGDEDGIYSPEAEQDRLEMQMFKSNANAVLENVSELTPFIMSHDWVQPYVEKLALNYVKRRIETPMIDGSFSAISRGLSQNLIVEYGLKQGEYLLTKAMKRKPVPLSEAEKEVLGKDELTLGELFSDWKARTNKGEDSAVTKLQEKLMTHTVIRVPADSVSGVRRLRLKGFVEADGFNVLLHPEDMKQLSGMDQDGDKVFVYEKLIPEMEQFFEQPHVRDQWYRFHRIEKDAKGNPITDKDGNVKIFETLSSRQYYTEENRPGTWVKEFLPTNEEGVTYKRSNDNVNMSLAMFDALSNAETNRAATRGNGLLGYGLNRMNAIREFLYQTKASEETIDAAWEMSRNIVNKSADAAKKGNPTVSREELGRILAAKFVDPIIEQQRSNQAKKALRNRYTYARELPRLLRAKTPEQKAMALEKVLEEIRTKSGSGVYDVQSMRYQVAELLGQLNYVPKAYRGVNDWNVYGMLQSFNDIFRDVKNADPKRRELVENIRLALHLQDFSLGGNIDNEGLTWAQDLDILYKHYDKNWKEVTVREAYFFQENKPHLREAEGYHAIERSPSEQDRIRNRNLQKGTFDMVHALLGARLASKMIEEDIAYWNERIWNEKGYRIDDEQRRWTITGNIGTREEGTTKVNLLPTSALGEEGRYRNGRAWRIIKQATKFRDADEKELELVRKNRENNLVYEGRDAKVREMIDYVSSLKGDDRQLFELWFLGSLHPQTKSLGDLKKEYGEKRTVRELAIKANDADTTISLEARIAKKKMLESELGKLTDEAATRAFYRSYTSKAAWQHAWVSDGVKRSILDSWNRLVGMAARVDILDMDDFAADLAHASLGRALPSIDTIAEKIAVETGQPKPLSAKEVIAEDVKRQEQQQEGIVTEPVPSFVPKVSELDVRQQAEQTVNRLLRRIAIIKAKGRASEEFAKELESFRQATETVNAPTPEEQLLAIAQNKELKVSKYPEEAMPAEALKALNELAWKGADADEMRNLAKQMTEIFVAHPELMRDMSLYLPGISQQGKYINVGIVPLLWAKPTMRRVVARLGLIGKKAIDVKLTKFDHFRPGEKIDEKLLTADWQKLLVDEALVVTRSGQVKQPVMEIVSRFGIQNRLAEADHAMSESAVAAMNEQLQRDVEAIAQLNIADTQHANLGHRIFELAVHQFKAKRKPLEAIKHGSLNISPREVQYRNEVIEKNKAEFEEAKQRHAALLAEGVKHTITETTPEGKTTPKVMTTQELVDMMEGKIRDVIQRNQDLWFFGEKDANGRYLSERYKHIVFVDPDSGYEHLDVKKTIESLMVGLGNRQMPKVGMGLLYRIARQMSVNEMNGVFRVLEYDPARYFDKGGEERWREDMTAFVQEKYGVRPEDITVFDINGSVKVKQKIGELSASNQVAAVTYLLRLENPQTGEKPFAWMVHDDLALQHAMSDMDGNWPRFDVPTSTAERHLRKRLEKEFDRTIDERTNGEYQVAAKLTNMMAENGTVAARKMLERLHDIATAKTPEDRLNLAKSFQPAELRKNETEATELMDEYNITPAALEKYQNGLAKTYFNTLYALTATHNIKEFKRERPLDGPNGEKHTEAWSYFMEEWARNVLGYPSTIPDEWLQNREYKKASSLYRTVYSDQAYLNLMKKIDRFMGNNYLTESEAIQKIQTAYQVASARKATKDLIAAERADTSEPEQSARRIEHYQRRLEDLKQHDVTDADFQLALRSIGREERFLRKIASVSNLEAKWQLLTLLSNTKTMINNMLGANINASVMVGVDKLRQYNDINYIRAKLGAHVNKEFKNAFPQKNGAHETMLKSELAFNMHAQGKAMGAALNEAWSEINTKPVWENVKGVWQVTKRASEIAKKHGVDQMIFEKAAWFMRGSEIMNRNRAWWAGYMKARDVLFAETGKWEDNDPWLIHMANKTVEASQFLYHTASRPMFMQTALGKVWHRFQLYAYRSITFRQWLNEQARMDGYEPESESYKRMARMVTADMFMLAMAGMFPASIFNSNLAEPMQTFANMADFLFGKKEDKEKAFYGALPYPMNILQPITPSISRYGTSVIGALIEGNWDKFVNYQVWAMFPFGRQVGMGVKTIEKPSMILENFVGLPVHRWQQEHTKYKKHRRDPHTMFDAIENLGKEKRPKWNDDDQIPVPFGVYR